ncbi:MAG: hypothetical protein KDD24_03600 [Flavobacteriales bacterium]|nr:hypothetical protein [Flavobacteriales bacterium]MCB9175226.1 hypothetical protein [Flavobacteriales bacterium]
MKKLMFPALIIGLIFASCSKDNSTPTPTTSGGGGGGGTPSGTFLIYKDSVYNSSNANDTRVRTFEYNSSKKVEKIYYRWGTISTNTHYDTVYYNTNNKVSKVEQYIIGNPTVQESKTYTYNGSNQLISVVEVGTNDNGPYTRTRTFTYLNNKVNSQILVYSSGSSNSNGGPDDLSNIVFTGNNITSLDLTGYGNATATYDTYANPYYGHNVETDDFTLMFCQNNLMSAYLTASPTTVFVNRAFTYSNGRLATIFDSSENRTTYITYQEY